MKKHIKLICSLLLLVTVLALFCACQTPTTPSYPVDFNKLLQKEYTNLRIQLKTQHQMGELANGYNVTKTENGVQVNYVCQSFAQLDISQPTENPIVTATGTVFYNANGEEISQQGDKVLFSLPKSTQLKLDLSTTNMANITEIDANNVKADIVNANVLFCQSVNATEVHIQITFTAEAISQIVVDYTTQSTKVTLTVTLG